MSKSQIIMLKLFAIIQCSKIKTQNKLFVSSQRPGESFFMSHPASFFFYYDNILYHIIYVLKTF